MLILATYFKLVWLFSDYLKRHAHSTSKKGEFLNLDSRPIMHQSPELLLITPFFWMSKKRHWAWSCRRATIEANEPTPEVLQSGFLKPVFNNHNFPDLWLEARRHPTTGQIPVILCSNISFQNFNNFHKGQHKQIVELKTTRKTCQNALYFLSAPTGHRGIPVHKNACTWSLYRTYSLGTILVCTVMINWLWWPRAIRLYLYMYNTTMMFVSWRSIDSQLLTQLLAIICWLLLRLGTLAITHSG